MANDCFRVWGDVKDRTVNWWWIEDRVEGSVYCNMDLTAF